MKIRFKKKHLKTSLIFGLLWLSLGIVALFFSSGTILKYGYLAMGVLYIALCLFHYKKQYLSIENGTITKHDLISQKMNLNEIKHVKKFAGDYILKSDTAELTINTEVIEEDST